VSRALRREQEAEARHPKREKIEQGAAKLWTSFWGFVKAIHHKVERGVSLSSQNSEESLLVGLVLGTRRKGSGVEVDDRRELAEQLIDDKFGPIGPGRKWREEDAESGVPVRCGKLSKKRCAAVTFGSLNDHHCGVFIQSMDSVDKVGPSDKGLRESGKGSGRCNKVSPRGIRVLVHNELPNYEESPCIRLRHFGPFAGLLARADGQTSERTGRTEKTTSESDPGKWVVQSGCGVATVGAKTLCTPWRSLREPMDTCKSHRYHIGTFTSTRIDSIVAGREGCRMSRTT
jgi:hypothetical protein